MPARLHHPLLDRTLRACVSLNLVLFLVVMGHGPRWADCAKAAPAKGKAAAGSTSTALDTSDCAVLAVWPAFTTKVGSIKDCTKPPTCSSFGTLVNETTTDKVVCTAEGKVQELNLDHIALTGAPPDSLSQLTALTALSLFDCGLTGTLPASWRSLTGLLKLDLSANNLKGPLPDAWGALSQVDTLSLNSNVLTGTLPSSWGNLTALTQLDLYSNVLSGTIPESWGSMKILAYLSLYDTGVSGPLPTAWINRNNWILLNLNNSKLCGKLPAASTLLTGKADSTLPECTNSSALSTSSSSSSKSSASSADGKKGGGGGGGGSNGGMIAGIVVGILAVVVFGAAGLFYFAVYRPKHKKRELETVASKNTALKNDGFELPHP